jgi:4-amino-4-deoxy-L-arabinose transferase-like glycosyltransferase
MSPSAALESQYENKMISIPNFVRDLIESYVRTIIDLLKIEAAVAYLKVLKGTRRFVIVTMLLFFFVVVLGCGFLLIPIALLLFMPWAPETKAIVGICIGAAYVVIPIIVISMLLSEKRWIRWSGVGKLIRQVNRPKS